MGRRSPSQDRKDPHGRPGRNKSERARAEAAHRREPDDVEAPTRSRSKPKPKPKAAPVICPRGKMGYSETVARAKLAEYARSPRAPVRVYHCPECDSWHLTSQPERGVQVAPPAPLPDRPRVPPPPKRLHRGG